MRSAVKFSSLSPQSNFSLVLLDIQPDAPGLPFNQRIHEKHLDRFAFVGAVAAPVWIEIAALFERIELRVRDVDRAVVDAVLPAAPVAAHRLANPSLALVDRLQARCNRLQAGRYRSLTSVVDEFVAGPVGS